MLIWFVSAVYCSTEMVLFVKITLLWILLVTPYKFVKCWYNSNEQREIIYHILVAVSCWECFVWYAHHHLSGVNHPVIILNRFIWFVEISRKFNITYLDLFISHLLWCIDNLIYCCSSTHIFVEIWNTQGWIQYSIPVIEKCIMKMKFKDEN